MWSHLFTLKNIQTHNIAIILIILKFVYFLGVMNFLKLSFSSTFCLCISFGLILKIVLSWHVCMKVFNVVFEKIDDFPLVYPLYISLTTYSGSLITFSNSSSTVSLPLNHSGNSSSSSSSGIGSPLASNTVNSSPSNSSSSSG